MLPVINPRHQDDLRMDKNSSPNQRPQFSVQIIDLFSAENSRSERGIGRMHGYVERRQSLFNDASQFSVGDIRQGDVIAMKEGQPEIVILNFKAGPNALGKLVYETEQAGIVADLRLELVHFNARIVTA
jgi:hypothetical protein